MTFSIQDKIFEPYLPAADIQEAVARIGGELRARFDARETVFLCVLKGAFMFFSDLMKHIGPEARQEFVFARSYAGTQSTGRVWLSELNTAVVAGRDVVVVEDVVDTGLTVNVLADRLVEAGARSVCICSCLYKPDAYRGRRSVDFVGFSIPNFFVVGYGLDYKEQGRTLTTIYKLKAS